MSRGQPRAVIFELFLRIAEGVAAAHGVGVTHRDLKPSNIPVDARDADLWGERSLRLALIRMARDRDAIDRAQLERLLDEVARTGPNNPLALLLATRAEEALLAEASALFRRALAFAADDDVRGYVHFVVGQRFAELGDVEAAKRHVDAARYNYARIYDREHPIFATICYPTAISLFYADKRFQLGTSLGVPSFVADTRESFNTVLAEALQLQGPCLIDARIDPEEMPHTLVRRARTLMAGFDHLPLSMRPATRLKPE